MLKRETRPKHKMGGNSSTSKATIINEISNQIRLSNVSKNESSGTNISKNIQSLEIQIGPGAVFDCPGLTIDQDIQSSSDLISKFETQTTADLGTSITNALNNMAKAYSQSGIWGVGNKSYSSTDLSTYIVNNTDMSSYNANIQKISATSDNAQKVTIVLDRGATLVIRVNGCNFYQKDVSQLQTASIMSAIYNTKFKADDLNKIVNDAESTSSAGGSPCGACGSGEIGGIAGGVVGIILILVVGFVMVKLFMGSKSSTSKPGSSTSLAVMKRVS